MEPFLQDDKAGDPVLPKGQKVKTTIKSNHPDVDEHQISKPQAKITEKHPESHKEEEHQGRPTAEIKKPTGLVKAVKKNDSIQGIQAFDDINDDKNEESQGPHSQITKKPTQNLKDSKKESDESGFNKDKHDRSNIEPNDSNNRSENIDQSYKKKLSKNSEPEQRDDRENENPDYFPPTTDLISESLTQNVNFGTDFSVKPDKSQSIHSSLVKKSTQNAELSEKQKKSYKKSDSENEHSYHKGSEHDSEKKIKKSIKNKTDFESLDAEAGLAENILSNIIDKSQDSVKSKSRHGSSGDSEEKEDKLQNVVNFQETFSGHDQSKALDKSKKHRKTEMSHEISKDRSRLKRNKSSSRSRSKSSSDSNQRKAVNQELVSQILNPLASQNEHRPESPETPNLGSPVKDSKKSKPLQGSAFWSRNEEELEKARLQEKLQEYEAVIQKQAEEIKELKKIISSQQFEKPKRQTSPKSSGFLHKKMEGTFLKREPELFRKEDLDFWKINDESQNNREPQKLEDIAALKDLWILNMESGNAMFNSSASKKVAGVKQNPLTKFETNKSANIKARILPKISSKKDMRK